MWLGHAAFLISLDGHFILTDPFLSDYASPVPLLGPKRFVAPALLVSDLPRFDVMLVSHNHYDHLDVSTVAALPFKDQVSVVVPLKLGAFFVFMSSIGMSPLRSGA